MKLAEKIVELAKKEIGVEEVNGTNTGPRVNEYKSATNLPPKEAWPWCAAFICFIVKKAMEECEHDRPYTFKRPTTAGAWDLENWSLMQDDSTQTKKPARGQIMPGDIVIFTFSHVGFATTQPDSNGMFGTVEGNTDQAGSREGGGVFAKRRNITQVRSRIRFTV